MLPERRRKVRVIAEAKILRDVRERLLRIAQLLERGGHAQLDDVLVDAAAHPSVKDARKVKLRAAELLCESCYGHGLAVAPSKCHARRVGQLTSPRIRLAQQASRVPGIAEEYLFENPQSDLIALERCL